MATKQELISALVGAGYDETELKTKSVKELESILKSVQVANAAEPEGTPETKEDIPQVPVEADEVIVPSATVNKNLVTCRVIKLIPNLYIAGERYSGSVKSTIRVPDYVADILREGGYIQ